MPLTGLILRKPKGSPLTLDEGDNNLIRIRDAFNALEQLFGVVLNPDGTLKPDSVGDSDVIADGIITNDKLADDARTPPGAILLFCGSVIPAGWLECRGQTVLKATYPDLFAALGSVSYGTAPSDSFYLPDLRGRVPVGVGIGAGLSNRVMAETFGEEKHLLTGEESGIAKHTHDAWGGAVQWIYTGGPTGGTGSAAKVHPLDVTLKVGELADTNAIEKHENMQPSIVLMYIIKF